MSCWAWVAATGALKLGRLWPAYLSMGGCNRRTSVWPRVATPCPRSGAEPGRTQCVKGSGQEELPMSEVRGSSWECQAATAQERREELPKSRSRAAAERSYPTSEIKGSGWEELSHGRSQGRWLGGPTPRRRSGGCSGTGGPRGAIPR